MVPRDGASVPANLPAIVWQPMLDEGGGGTQPDPSKVTLVATDAPGAPIALTVDSAASTGRAVVLVPATPLVAGKTYRLADATVCAYGGATSPPATFVATAVMAPLLRLARHDGRDATRRRSGPRSPPRAGELQRRRHCRTRSISRSRWSADAAPWRDVLLYSTVVDSGPWNVASSINQLLPPGESWIGRGKDRIFERCDNNPDPVFRGLATDIHAVVFHATLAATQLDLATDQITVATSCTGDGSGSGSDPTDPTTTPPEAAGCSSTSPATPGLLLGALVLGLRRRRPRR